jgi:hypothetical protein
MRAENFANRGTPQTSRVRRQQPCTKTPAITGTNRRAQERRLRRLTVTPMSGDDVAHDVTALDATPVDLVAKAKAIAGE